MIKGLFGATTAPATLRAGLQDTMNRHREIAARVAGALNSSAQTSGAVDAAAAAAAQESDLVDDMAQLADTQLRFEAEARILNLTYRGLRTAIRGNG